MSVNIFTSQSPLDKLAKPSFAREIMRLMPQGTAPLFALSSMLGEEVAVQTEHGYFAKIMLFPSVVVSTAATASDTTLTCANSTVNDIIPGMVLQVASYVGSAMPENVLVTAVNYGANQITVSRGVGSVAAAAIPVGTTLLQIGNVQEEGSDQPIAQRIDTVRVSNLTQIFRNSWQLTGTATATEVFAGESNVAENRGDCGKFHAADIEKSLFFGQKAQGTRNGKPYRTMDGIIAAIAGTKYLTNNDAVKSTTANRIYTAGATTTYTQLEAMLDPVFDTTTNPSMANERVLFTGGTGIRVLTQIGRLNGTIQLVESQSSFGMQFQMFRTSRGKFRIIEHPLFNSNAAWSAMAVVVDLSGFKMAYLGNRKTVHQEYNSSGNQVFQNAVDAVGGVLTTECTTVVQNPTANCVIRNLTAGAAG